MENKFKLVRKLKVGPERKSSSSNWRGGEQKNSQGYILSYCPEHPQANTQGYIRKHRVVMERKLGRFLTKDERVHHKDGVKTNNNIDNLELFSSESEHQSSIPHKYGKFVCKGREVEYQRKYQRERARRIYGWKPRISTI